MTVDGLLVILLICVQIPTLTYRGGSSVYTCKTSWDGNQGLPSDDRRGNKTGDHTRGTNGKFNYLKGVFNYRKGVTRLGVPLFFIVNTLRKIPRFVYLIKENKSIKTFLIRVKVYSSGFEYLQCTVRVPVSQSLTGLNLVMVS